MAPDAASSGDEREHVRSIANDRKPSLASWPSTDSSTSSTGGGGPKANDPGHAILSPQVSSPPSSVDASPKYLNEQNHGVFEHQFQQTLDARDVHESSTELARTPTNPFPEHLQSSYDDSHDERANIEALPPCAKESSSTASATHKSRAREHSTDVWQTDDLLSPVASSSAVFGGQSPALESPTKYETSVRGTPRKQTQRSASWKQGEVFRDNARAESPGDGGNGSSGSGGNLLSRQVQTPQAGSPRALTTQAPPYTPSSFSPRSTIQSSLTNPASHQQYGNIAKGAFGIVRGIEGTEATESESRNTELYRRSSISSVISSGYQEDEKNRTGAFAAAKSEQQEDSELLLETEKDALPDLPTFSSPLSSSSLNSAAPTFSPLGGKLHNGSHPSSGQHQGFPFTSLAARKNSLPTSSYGQYPARNGGEAQQPANGQLNHYAEPFNPSSAAAAVQGSSLGLSNIAGPGRISRSQVNLINL